MQDSTSGPLTIKALIMRGVQGGLGYGWAVCMVHLAMGMSLIIALGMAPLTWFSAKTLLMEPPLAMLFGLALSPLHLLKRGRFIHPAGLVLIWVAMERFVAVDPDKLQMWLLPPLAALALVYGFGERKRSSWSPWRPPHRSCCCRFQSFTTMWAVVTTL